MKLKHILKIEQAKLLKNDILEHLTNPINVLYRQPVSYYYIKLRSHERYDLVDIEQLSVIKEKSDNFDDEYDLYPTLMVEEMIELLFPVNIDEYVLKFETFIGGVPPRRVWNVAYINNENDIFSFGDNMVNILFCSKAFTLIGSLFELYKKYKNYLEWKTKN